jgi:hypothetical protein
VPTPAEAVEAVLAAVGDILGGSSLRLGIGPTLVLLAILLVLLQRVARPVTRWVSSDAGGLGGIGNAMAVAAESGTDAVVTLGTGGIARATDALARIQTLAAMPILAHVARSAARSGVAVRVLVNDPLVETAARATIASAHERTETLERLARSRVVLAGEGRQAMAGLALTARARPAAAIAVGSLREEAMLQLEGLRDSAGVLNSGTAEAAQAPAPLLGSGGALVGPAVFQAAADLRADLDERSMVLAANRLLVGAIVALVLATALSLAGVIEPIDVMLGLGQR